MTQPFHTYTEYYGAGKVINQLRQRKALGILSEHDKSELDKLIQRHIISVQFLKTKQTTK